MGVGDKVIHWFRGKGVIESFKNKTIVFVKFKDGIGECYLFDLSMKGGPHA